jgi:D-xylose transport system permease protein
MIGKDNLKKIDLRNYVMIGALFLIWVLFTVLTDGTFLVPRNLSNLTRQMAIVGVLGTGMVLVIITGNIDLSVGSVMGALGGIAAAIHIWGGLGPYLTIGIVLVGGALIGFGQGVVISYFKVPAFIVTLGGLLSFRGVLLGVTKGVSIAPFDDAIKYFGQAYIPIGASWAIGIVGFAAWLFIQFQSRRSRLRFGFQVDRTYKVAIRTVVAFLLIMGVVAVLNSYRGIPVPVFIMIVLVLILTFVTEKTVFGRSIYAMGGNIEATLYSGIRVERNLVIVYVINGVMAAIAGLILAARLNAGTPSAGFTLELDAIAAAVIGGASMSGGTGKVAGAILGALFMATMDNGMSLMNVDAYWQYIVKGIILVIAVWFDIYSSKKK